MYLSCNIHCKVAEISLPNDHPGELQKVIDTAKGQHTLLIVAVIQSAKRMVRHYLPTPLQAIGGCWLFDSFPVIAIKQGFDIATTL